MQFVNDLLQLMSCFIENARNISYNPFIITPEKIMTEKSLKQNKFKEGKISGAISTFLPKKSFNRIININLINSKNFKEKTNDDYIAEKKEFLKEKIQLRNKKSEIVDLKNFGTLDKFENFTFKTIDKRENIVKTNSMKNILKIAY